MQLIPTFGLNFMNSLHVRRNFLKLAKRIGLFSFSALGAGTALGFTTAQSAQSKQTFDSKQIQDLAERVKTLEAQLPLDKVVEISQNSPQGERTVFLKPLLDKDLDEKIG